MKKILLSILLVFTLLPHSVQAFSDTNDEAVNYLRTHQVFDQTENYKFNPTRKARRGEFVMWALRNRDVLFSEGEFGLEPYKDVLKSAKFQPYVAEAWKMGAINTADKFAPYRPITRLEAIKIVFALEGIPTPRAGFNLRKYKDLPSDAISQGIIAKALEMRLIAPEKEDYFGVNKQMTRLESAWFLYSIRLIADADDTIFGQQERAQTDSLKAKERIFDQIWNIIHKKYLYIDDVSDEALMEAAIGGMVDSLGDPYTVFFTEEETGNFLSPLKGSLSGIGAQVGFDPDSGIIFIVAPLKDSPAEKAGLKSGDVISLVDGVDIAGMQLEEAISLIKGRAGTSVSLTILRDGKKLVVEVVRAKIIISAVELVENKDGYLVVKIITFSSNIVRELDAILDKNLNSRTKGIIIDLRNNPGGFLSSAKGLLDFFFEDEVIALKVHRIDSLEKYKTRGKGRLADLPLVILQNANSASASEIFAGAIQDHERGLIIGSQSYGKGVVQELSQFYDRSSLKITIAEWLTPKGRGINHIGIAPDILMETQTNEQILFRAISELKKKR